MALTLRIITIPCPGEIFLIRMHLWMLSLLSMPPTSVSLAAQHLSQALQKAAIASGSVRDWETELVGSRHPKFFANRRQQWLLRFHDPQGSKYNVLFSHRTSGV